MGHHFLKGLGNQYLKLCRLYMAHSLYLPFIADEMQWAKKVFMQINATVFQELLSHKKQVVRQIWPIDLSVLIPY